MCFWNSKKTVQECSRKLRNFQNQSLSLSLSVHPAPLTTSLFLPQSFSSLCFFLSICFLLSLYSSQISFPCFSVHVQVCGSPCPSPCLLLRDYPCWDWYFLFTILNPRERNSDWFCWNHLPASRFNASGTDLTSGNRSNESELGRS